MTLQNTTQSLARSFLSGSSLTQTLGEEFVLCENGNMIFHWADFFETCDLIKTQLENDSTLMEDFKNKEVALNRLSLIPVWIRTERKVHQSTMFDLYEKYILNQTQILGGLDPFGPLEISFISGTGPFKAMSIAECFNHTTYKDFVLLYLIKGKLPKRDYRIRLKAKILMEYAENYKEAQLISLEQLTMHGLLFSVDSDLFMKKVSKEENVRFLINSQMLHEADGKNLIELKSHLSQYAFNLMYSSQKEDAFECEMKDVSVQSSFDFSKNKKVYLFVSYKTLSQKHPEQVKRIQKFVTHTKELVREHYQNFKKEKSA